MEPIVVDLYLDVYDHDLSPSVFKTIARDSHTRFVQAFLQKEGFAYQPNLDSTVTLIALRPDGNVIEGTGEITELAPNFYGVKAEITRDMIFIKGNVSFQFKIEEPNEILRTEIFKSNNGIALEAEAERWAGRSASILDLCVLDFTILE